MPSCAIEWHAALYCGAPVAAEMFGRISAACHERGEDAAGNKTCGCDELNELDQLPRPVESVPVINRVLLIDFRCASKLQILIVKRRLKTHVENIHPDRFLGRAR